MTEIKTTAPGTVKIADEAVAVIAGAAALEAEGVAGLAGHSGKKHVPKGVSVLIEGGEVKLSVEITVKHGTKVQEVSREVQQKIKAAVENMTGLNVTQANVTIGAVSGEKQRLA